MKIINQHTKIKKGCWVELVPQTNKSKEFIMSMYGHLYLKLDSYDNINSLSGLGDLLRIDKRDYQLKEKRVIVYYKNGFLLLGNVSGSDYRNFGEDEFFYIYKLNKKETKVLSLRMSSLDVLNALGEIN